MEHSRKMLVAISHVVFFAWTARAQSVSESLVTPTTFSTLSTTSSVTSLPSSSSADASTSSSTDSPQTSFSFPAPARDPDTEEEERSSNLANLYFVFLILFWVVIVIAFVWVRRRRRMLKAEARSGGQHALARDIDGWVNTRRWIRGNWRDTANGSTRREEGLNELGEAPPPYKVREDVGTAVHERADDGNGHLAVPLRTLSREGRASLKPPGYEESIYSVQSTRPNTAATDVGNLDQHLIRSPPPSAYR